MSAARPVPARCGIFSLQPNLLQDRSRHLPSPLREEETTTRACPLPSSLDPGRPGLWPEGAWTPAQLPSPRACSWPTRRRAILTQARKGDGGVMLGARLLGAVRVWAEAGRCLPAVVRLLLLRGHGQAALPGRPAGGLPWHLRGAPAQDGLNGEAGDAAGRRTPLACIFLAAHPGFIRNRRKPRTPFRDDLGGRWCRQAGGGGAGRGAGGGGGGGEGGEASPLRGDRRARDGCAGIPACPALGAPAQPRRECPFLARQLAGSPPARRWSGLICIEVSGTRPIAAPPSGPGNFQKSPGPARSHCASRSAPRTRRASAVSNQGQPGRKQHRFQPTFLASVATATSRTPGPSRGRGSAGLRAAVAPTPPSGDVSSHRRRSSNRLLQDRLLASYPFSPGFACRTSTLQIAASGRGGRGVRIMLLRTDALPWSLTVRPGSRQLLPIPAYRSHPCHRPSGPA